MAYYGLQVSWKGSGVDEYKLKWFFNPFGALDIIMENSRYGSSQNSAFIKFPTQQIAESAQRQTNGSSLQGCIIQTTVQRRAALITPSFQPYQSEARLQQYSHQSQEQLPPPNPPKNVDRKTLVVNNLNPITSEASLRKVFNEYHCTTISIPKNQQRGAQIHGFVSFSRDSDASTAMEQINGRVIDRHKVEISYKPLRSSSASQLRPLSDFKSYTYPPQSQIKGRRKQKKARRISENITISRRKEANRRNTKVNRG
ncbi:MAG: hypothetical protein EZS28_008832 [Streblomastix strix]|uniref:RRM domain-containing protein n=1 Tax=Streblomastix strix TaxID=222440 RepID=A0A5J4WL99_9EUKA|nr:MAG: hypothetical protein EZS28_008832 [Streblomastix strix]